MQPETVRPRLHPVASLAPSPASLPPAPPSLAGAHVRIRGLGSIGVSAAEAAVRSSVACLSLVDPDPRDAGAGTTPALARGTRARRAARLVSDLDPRVRVDLDTSRRVDGEVVVAYVAVEPWTVHELLLGGPHIAVLVDEAGAAVIPVDPGRTPCLRCLDVARTERDPAWPTLAALHAATDPATDPLTAALAGAMAAASLARLIVRQPARAWRIEAGVPRRTRLSARPECGCGAA